MRNIYTCRPFPLVIHLPLKCTYVDRMHFNEARFGDDESDGIHREVTPKGAKNFLFCQSLLDCIVFVTIAEHTGRGYSVNM